MKLFLSFFTLILLTLQSFTYGPNETSEYRGAVQDLVKDATLFVIKVPINEQNKADIEVIKSSIVDGVSIKEEGDFLTLEYIGKELTSAVSPDFVEDVFIYKGDKAKEKYPNAPENGVIEIIVLDAKILSSVLHEIKTY